VRWVIFASNPELEAEARASASEILAAAGQVQIEVHAFRESFFPFIGASIKEEFERLKSAIQPDLVLTHRVRDLHQDHRIVGEGYVEGFYVRKLVI